MRWSRRALASVLDQDLDNLEVLIGDETGEAQGGGRHRRSPGRYHRNPERLGFTANHRTLLDQAQGRYMAVLHDDDWWEPTYLSSLVGVLESDAKVGLACSGTIVDRGENDSEPWPVAVSPGRHDDALDILLARGVVPPARLHRVAPRGVVGGGTRLARPVLCRPAVLHVRRRRRLGLYYLPDMLYHWVQHDGQSGAWQGSDNGLGVADDVLAFWEGWLEGRPGSEVTRAARQRARWQMRRARALVLAGRPGEARMALRRATALQRTAGLERRDLPGLRRLTVASRLPTPVVLNAIDLKRAMSRRSKLTRSVERRFGAIAPDRSVTEP